MKPLAALLLALGACAPAPFAPSPPKPGQETALAIIWQEMGVPAREVSISWVEGEDLDCMNGEGFLYEGVCLAGVEVLGTMKVAWGPGNTWASIALAHEVCHAAFGDTHHRRQCVEARGAGQPTEMSQRVWRALVEAFPEQMQPHWSAPR